MHNFSEYRHFWSKQIKKVYIPCLIWSIPWLLLDFLKHDSALDIIKSSIDFFTCGYSIYYFIALVIECYLLFPILKKCQNRLGSVLIFLVTFGSMIFFEFLSYYKGFKIPLNIYCSFLTFALFFFIGMILSNKQREYSLIWPILLMMCGMGINYFETYYIFQISGYSSVGQKLSMIIFNSGFVLFFFSIKIQRLFKQNNYTNLILYFGELSFGIYFIHSYIIIMIGKSINFISANWVLLWLISAILSLCLIKCLKYILPSKTYKYIALTR